MLPVISPEETYRRLQEDEIILVDIRDVPEVEEISIPGALLAPLLVVEQQLLHMPDAPDKPLVFTCRSGRRTEAAAERLAALPHAAYQMQGGLVAWAKAGLPVERHPAPPMSIMRQMQVAAGSLVLCGTLGSFHWPPLVWLAAFVGAGLLVAGVTGFCGMAVLLGKMPWNRR